MARKKQQPRKEPSHESVVSSLLDMQAQLRGETARDEGGRRSSGRRAVVTVPPVLRVIDLTDRDVVRIPDGAPSAMAASVSDVASRIASIQARMDRLEEELASVMSQLEDRRRGS